MADRLLSLRLRLFPLPAAGRLRGEDLPLRLQRYGAGHPGVHDARGDYRGNRRQRLQGA